MCARRLLFIVVMLTLLVVAGAFAIYQWGGRVLVQQAVPKGHFEAATAGSGPDYALSSSWVARPGEADDPSTWVPGGTVRGAPGKAAIFFIHPTTYLETDR